MVTRTVEAVELPADLARAYLDVHKEIKRLTGVADALKDAIKERLGEQEYGSVDGTPVIRWMHIKQRRLDLDALRANVDPVVLESCYTQEESRRFVLVSPKESRDEKEQADG